jgi:hypothetical protein
MLSLKLNGHVSHYNRTQKVHEPLLKCISNDATFETAEGNLHLEFHLH